MTTSLETFAPDAAGTSRPKRTVVLVAWLLVLELVASLCYPIAKAGLAVIEPFTFAFYRYLVSSVVLLLIVSFKKYALRIERKDYRRIILLGLLIIPFNQTLFLVGQALTGAGHGAFLFATTPVFIFILAIIHLKEKLIWRRAAGIAVALAGVMVIMLSGTLDVGMDYLLGDIIIMVSVTAWAYYTILGKDLVRKYGALRMTAYVLASGSAMYFPFGLYRALVFDYSQATPAAWGAVLYMALGMSVFVYFLWYWLLKYMEASRLAVYQNIQPVIATVAAYFFLGEALTMPFVLGGAVVLVGVLTSEL